MISVEGNTITFEIGRLLDAVLTGIALFYLADFVPKLPLLLVVSPAAGIVRYAFALLAMKMLYDLDGLDDRRP